MFGLFVAFVVLLLQKQSVKDWIHANKKKFYAILGVIVVLAAGIFFLKKDSAIGRFHIWDMQIRAIASHPLLGNGTDSYIASYCREQANYFKAGGRSPIRIRVAGCLPVKVNDYLGLGVEHGIFAMLAFIAIIYFGIKRLLRKKSLLAYGLIVWGVFAIFSFPLAVKPLCIILLALLFAAYLPCCCGKKMIWEIILLAVVMSLSIYKTIPAIEERPSPYRSYYKKAHDLQAQRHYKESNALIKEGGKYCKAPEFHILAAQNYEKLRQYDMAEKEYLQAHYIVPCRIEPMLSLMKMYQKTGRKDDAIRIGEEISGMWVNPNNAIMCFMYREARMLLAELKGTPIKRPQKVSGN